MTDFRIKQNFNFADPLWDLVLRDSGLIDEREELATAVRVALGTDALANTNDILPDPDSTDRRGWWGNMDAESIWDGWNIGTKNWLLTRAKITEAPSEEGATLQRAEQYTIDALQPFIARGVASQVEVHATRVELNRIDVQAIIYRGPLPEIDLRFQLLWLEPDAVDIKRIFLLPPFEALELSVQPPIIEVAVFSLKDLVARSLAVQAPVISRPTFALRNLFAASISVAAPVLGTSVLPKVLTAASKTVSAPVLFYSTISLGPTLFASSLTAGSPQLGIGQTSLRLLVAAPLVVGSPLLGPAVEESSAGVFDSSNRLVRTLWSAQRDYIYAGAPQNAWDGTLDDGSIAPTGNYTIKVLTHRTTYAWEGVIGNSSPNHINNLIYHNPASTIWGMAITDAGEMYYSTSYTERWSPFHYTTEANPQVTNYLSIQSWSPHEVCTDGTIAYFAWQGNEVKNSWIVGFNCSTKQTVHFTFANRNVFSDIWVLEYSDPNDYGGYLGGLAVQKTGNYLFAARGAIDIIHSYHKTTGQFVQTFTGLDQPGAIATNPTSSTEVWVAYTGSGTTRNRIAKLTCNASTGALTASGVTISTGIQDVMAMAVSPDGTRLLVADGGTSQQVKAFNTSNGTVQAGWAVNGVFGTANGYGAGPLVTDTKFMFSPNFNGMGGGGPYIAYSSNGSFWLGDPGNNRNLHFSAGNSPTVLEKIEFVPALYSCRVCRNAPTRVFGNMLEWELDYSKPLAPGNGSWALKYNWGYGLTAPDHYDALQWVGQYSNGRVYAGIMLNDAQFHICELNTTVGLRDTGKIVLKNYTELDDAMNLYYSPEGLRPNRIWKNPFTGFDGSNNPTWQYSTTDASLWPTWLITETLPTSFPDQSIPYVNPTAANIVPVHNWHSAQLPQVKQNHFGGIDLATGQIKFSTYPPVRNYAPNGDVVSEHYGGPGLNYLFYPEAPYFPTGDAVTDNGGGDMEYVAGRPDIFTGYRGEGWGALQTNVWTHWHDSGLVVSRWGPVMPTFAAWPVVAPNVNMQTGQINLPAVWTAENSWIYWKGAPGAAGNSRWGGIARVSNKYYLFQGDEWFHSGIHRWKIENTDSVHIVTTRVAWNSSSYVAPSLNASELLAGLPYDAWGIPEVAGWHRSNADMGPNRSNPPYLATWTNVTKADWRGTPDLMLHVSTASGYLTDWWLARDLPSSVGTHNWRIDGKMLQVSDGWRNSPTSQNLILLEVIDPAGKVIVQLGNYADYTGSQTTRVMRVNNQPIVWPAPPSFAWEVTRGGFSDIIIDANVTSGTITVTYASYSIQVTAFDASADIYSPAKFRIRYSATGSSVAFEGGVCLKNLFYSESAAAVLRPVNKYFIMSDTTIIS